MEPIVTAEKFLEYKRGRGHLGDFLAPETVLVCYQDSTLQYLLAKYSECCLSKAVSHLYLLNEGKVGILGGWGVGAPGLAFEMEILIALGVKRFLAIGTAGALMGSHQVADFVLCLSALAEDGVAHHYLPPGQRTVEPSPQMMLQWAHFVEQRGLPQFVSDKTWSFSAMFRETVEDMRRVRELGCGVVEMEAATLYAIGQEKGVQALTLLVISDLIDQEAWTPHNKEPAVRNRLHQLADWTLEFCQSGLFAQNMDTKSQA